MLKGSKVGGVAPGSAEGARSATGGEPGAAADVKRWSAGRKKEVVLRLLRGEPVDAISREVSVPIYKLEKWRDRALAGIDAGLKERETDPVERQLDEAKRRIGELGVSGNPIIPSYGNRNFPTHHPEGGKDGKGRRIGEG